MEKQVVEVTCKHKARNTKRCKSAVTCLEAVRQKRAQELLRKGPPSYTRPTLVKTPPEGSAQAPVKLLLPLPPRFTHDGRVESLSRRLLLALHHFQNESELYILVDLLQNSSSWFSNVWDVFQSPHVPKGSQLSPGEHNRYCRVRLACEKEESRPRRKALPPRWTD